MRTQRDCVIDAGSSGAGSSPAVCCRRCSLIGYKTKPAFARTYSHHQSLRSPGIATISGAFSNRATYIASFFNYLVRWKRGIWKVNPMPKDIFIVDKEYTFQESTHILTQAISSIVDENDETVFSIADILRLLRSVNEHVPVKYLWLIAVSRSYLYPKVNKLIASVSMDVRLPLNFASAPSALVLSCSTKSASATSVGAYHNCLITTKCTFLEKSVTFMY